MAALFVSVAADAEALRLPSSGSLRMTPLPCDVVDTLPSWGAAGRGRRSYDGVEVTHFLP